jgi:nucleoside-diphosphate-sugar epimerase
LLDGQFNFSGFRIRLRPRARRNTVAEDYHTSLSTAIFLQALGDSQYMTARVLVTGGTGFIGSYVAADMLEAGHDVIAYDLSTDDRILSKLDIAEDVEIRRGDVTDPTDVIRAVRETDASHIIHLAALLTNAAEDNPRAAMDVNIQGTNNVFEAARTLDDQVERVAWASSAAAYAPPSNYDGDWVTEADLVSPDTLYGATKAYNEHQARVYREEFGVSDVALRPTVAYGPYRETGGSAFLANIVEKPALGESFSVEYGDQVIDWQHVADIAQAFRKAAFTPEAELSQRVYNVRGEVATIREAVETMRELVPDADLSVSDEGELPWTQRLDMTPAREDLGYEPEYDLETGFRQYANVLREEAGLESL